MENNKSHKKEINDTQQSDRKKLEKFILQKEQQNKLLQKLLTEINNKSDNNHESK